MKSKTTLFLSLLPLFLYGCNSGGSVGSTNTNFAQSTNSDPQHGLTVVQQQTSLAAAANNNSVRSVSNVIHNGVVNLTKLALKQQLNGNGHDLSTQDSAIDSSVGWDSSTQSFAPASCWSYNITLENSSFSGSTFQIKTNRDIMLDLGFSASISEKVLDLSQMNGGAAFNNLLDTSSEAYDMGAEAWAKATASVHVTGLNQTGTQILENQPAIFNHLCGDQVIQSIPVKVQAIYTISYKSQSFNDNESMSSTFGTKEGFVDTAVSINQSMKASKSTVTISDQEYTQGDVNLSDKTSFGACTESANEAGCQDALNGLNSAVQAGFTDAQKQISEANGQNVDWQSLLAVDFSNQSQFQMISASQELKLLGVTNPPSDGALFAPYESAIIHNLNVLQDLEVASTMFKNISIGISNLPNDFASDFTPYYNNNELSQAYQAPLTTSVNALTQSINSCLGSNSAQDAATNCGSLDPNSTIQGIVRVNYLSNPGFPQLEDSIEKTLDALIYVDNVTRDNLYTNGNPYASNLSSVGAYIVYLPAKQLDPANQRSPYVLVTIPRIQGSNTNSTSTYIGAYQVAANNPNQIFWGDWDSFSALRSGQVGYYDGYSEILFPASDRTGTIDSMSSYALPGQTCTPFGASSAGCTYVVNTQMDVATTNNEFSAESLPMGQVTQTIIDSYNPNLAPSGNELFGSNQFATLYPFKKQN